MFNRTIDEPPRLESAIESDDYIDSMSAPRVDPTRPEMTGWAMKLRRQKRRSSNVRRGSGKAPLEALGEGAMMDSS